MVTKRVAAPMMDPAIKTALALGVLLGGVCAAMLCRGNNSGPAVPDSVAEEAVLLRYRAEAAARRAAKQQKNAEESPAASENAKKPLATVVTPLRQSAPPPLAAEYPEPARQNRAPAVASMEMMLPGAPAAENSVRSHTVVDGDTLAALADRFLGSESRANEIFEANRDVLHDPNMLPIGAELKIPPRAGR